MSGPPDSVEWGWKELHKHIDMDPPTPTFDNGSVPTASDPKRSARYLGCEHITQTVSVNSDIAKKLLAESAPVRIQPPDKQMEQNEAILACAKAVNGQINIVKYDTSGALSGAVGKFLAIGPQKDLLVKLANICLLLTKLLDLQN